MIITKKHSNFTYGMIGENKYNKTKGFKKSFYKNTFTFDYKNTNPETKILTLTNKSNQMEKENNSINSTSGNHANISNNQGTINITNNSNEDTQLITKLIELERERNNNDRQFNDDFISTMGTMVKLANEMKKNELNKSKSKRPNKRGK